MVLNYILVGCPCVVPVHGPWSGISKTSHLKSLGRKEGSRLRLCFRVVDHVSKKKGMDLWKQMLSSKCSFTCICGIFLPLNPSTTTVYARSAFYPSLRFTLSLQSTFYPWFAVCSPQSAVRSLRLTLTVSDRIRNPSKTTHKDTGTQVNTSYYFIR